MNLWDLKINDAACVECIVDENSSNVSVLSELGIARNSVIKCLHKSFFGGPRVYEINGIVCSLCKKGAEKIILKKA